MMNKINLLFRITIILFSLIILFTPLGWSGMPESEDQYVWKAEYVWDELLSIMIYIPLVVIGIVGAILPNRKNGSYILYVGLIYSGIVAFINLPALVYVIIDWNLGPGFFTLILYPIIFLATILSKKSPSGDLGVKN